MIQAARVYSGQYDILVWNDIPPEAIVNCFPVVEFTKAVTSSLATHLYFRLDLIQKSYRMPSVAKRMASAKACKELEGSALSEFSLFALAKKARDREIVAKFVEQVRIDFDFDHRLENRDTSKHYLPTWPRSNSWGSPSERPFYVEVITPEEYLDLVLGKINDEAPEVAMQLSTMIINQEKLTIEGQNANNMQNDEDADVVMF
jgi:hypothetical protein